MRDFLFYLTDDRDPVPSSMFVVAENARSARSIAERLLAGQPHYRKVEAWDDEGKLFSLGEVVASVA